MAAEERDSTADWIVPAERLPPSAFELQRQIDVATGIARAAEEAAMEIGAASLEAAEQARRAAAHAERSAEASLAAARAASGQASAAVAVPSVPASAPAETPPGHESIPGSELPPAWSPVAGPAANGDGRPRKRAPASNGGAPSWGPAPAPTDPDPPPAPVSDRPGRRSAQPDPFDERMVAFRRRAERVMARLVRLEVASPVS